MRPCQCSGTAISFTLPLRLRPSPAHGTCSADPASSCACGDAWRQRPERPRWRAAACGRRANRDGIHPWHDTLSEWLRRWTRNPLGSARRGSNPLGVDFVQASGRPSRKQVLPLLRVGHRRIRGPASQQSSQRAARKRRHRDYSLRRWWRVDRAPLQ
jgi:hypothetical protein